MWYCNWTINAMHILFYSKHFVVHSLKYVYQFQYVWNNITSLKSTLHTIFLHKPQCDGHAMECLCKRKINTTHFIFNIEYHGRFLKHMLINSNPTLFMWVTIFSGLSEVYQFQYIGNNITSMKNAHSLFLWIRNLTAF